MKKISTFLLAILSLTFINAQENLVPNPSFEEVEDKIKEGGMIELAYPWQAATMNPVDLYSEKSKNEDFSVPKNAYGSEPANTGTNYAGISLFGFGGRLPRTYLGVELNQELEEGKEYCMKFHVSMADFSKYAVNNLAIYVDFESIVEKTDGILKLVPHVKSLKNEAFEKQYLWTAVCGIYKAEGGEKFIAIGNFDSNEQTIQKKIRLSKEFAGNRQQNNAYYYIDDVSVVELTEETKADCLCDKIAGGRMKTEFKSFGTDESKKAEANKTFLVNSDGSKVATGTKEKEVVKEFNIETAEVFFGDKSAKISEESSETINKMVEYLKANKAAKIKLTGHADASETEAASIDKLRAFAVKKKLIALGVIDSQISYFAAGTKQAKKTGDAAQNRRVSISLN